MNAAPSATQQPQRPATGEQRQDGQSQHERDLGQALHRSHRGGVATVEESGDHGRLELMDVFDPWRQGLVRVVEELVRCAGRDDPALRAAVGVAAIEGVLATAVRMPTGRRPAFVRAAVPLVVRGLHVTG